MDLSTARKEILRVDTEIINQIKKRFDLADAVVEAKKAQNLPVVDENQRKQVLDRSFHMAKLAGIDAEKTRAIFEILIEMNEDRQNKLR